MNYLAMLCHTVLPTKPCSIHLQLIVQGIHALPNLVCPALTSLSCSTKPCSLHMQQEYIHHRMVYSQVLRCITLRTFSICSLLVRLGTWITVLNTSISPIGSSMSRQLVVPIIISLLPCNYKYNIIMPPTQPKTSGFFP